MSKAQSKQAETPASESSSNQPTDGISRAEQARQEAIDLAADTMGELIAFWGFKASMGRIWTLLYLSEDPMPANDIAERSQLSTGAVSMALTELQQWGLVDRRAVAGRKRHYAAETDIWGIIKRIVRERELRLVGRAVQRFTKAVEVLQAAEKEDPDPKTRFMLRRLQGLLALAHIGYGLVKQLGEQGIFSLGAIKGALGGGGVGQASSEA